MLPAPVAVKAPLKSGPPLGRAVLRFFLAFGLIYGLLIAPWPGFKEGYGRYFRSLCGVVFAGNPTRYLQFEPSPDSRFSIGVQIVLGNNDKVDANGHLPVQILGLEARGVGWIPTALLIALTLVSPVSWRRRAWSLFWGVLLVHGFILFSVACYLWNQSTELGLLSASPFGKAILGGLEETLVTQLGASFAVPVVIWFAVTFRLRNFASAPR
jgi:hypothetical protein